MTDKAALVEANSDKLDLEHFYRDLPKYLPYLSPLACDHWKDFELLNSSSIAVGDVTWGLPTLVSAAILSRQSTTEHDHPISRETLRLLDKEVATPKPVCCLICLY